MGELPGRLEAVEDDHSYRVAERNHLHSDLGLNETCIAWRLPLLVHFPCSLQPFVNTCHIVQDPCGHVIQGHTHTLIARVDKLGDDALKKVGHWRPMLFLKNQQ